MSAGDAAEPGRPPHDGPPPAPDIEGLRYLGDLGSGGYSEVYLYEQQVPRMPVAVKVLTDTRLSQAELDQFAAEAETMAALSDHPYIVQVFRTGTTADGRPFIVMKYYPPPNLARRVEQHRMSVADVLSTGIKIASAVETAHRAGILHRDIKPANILIGPYGEPGLADFGIAATTADADEDDDVGVSTPWSPPEILDGTSNGSVTTDVYSLGATLWHLLAGRSPFEVPGGDNRRRVLVGRILTVEARPTARPDVPASLERLLQSALAKTAARRPSSAVEFARVLQSVEQELRYAKTPIALTGDGATARNPVVPAVQPTAPVPALPASAGSDARDEPVTMRRPLRPSPSRPSSTESAGDEPDTTRRPARPGPRTSRRPSRFAPRGDIVPKTATTSADPSEVVATRARGLAPKPQQGSLAVGRQEADAPSTTRRPVAPSSSGAVPPPPRARRLPVKVLVGGAVVACAAAVGVGIALAGGSTAGNHPATGDSPSGPVGTNQGGFGTTAPVPVVVAVYDAGARTLTFSWSGQAGGRFVYSVNGGASVGPTTAGSVVVRTTDPATVCIVVGAVGADGDRHLAAPKCGA